MLLVDALYIHNGGGRVLLDYLISELEKQNIDCFYLLDSRINYDNFKIKNTNIIVYTKASIWNRYLFYKKNKKRFTTIFCLGNLPPNIRLNAKVVTYFHSQLYISASEENSIVDAFKYELKRIVLRLFSKNTDFWFLQTASIATAFREKFKVENEKIKLMPFYRLFEKKTNSLERINNTYLYVSNATVHKNHLRLLDAFCLFYDKYKIGSLVLTVSKEYEKITQLITQKKEEGYPIVNVGFIDRDNLMDLYLQSQYLIFPSLSESFGLGIVEGVNCGCKIIAADLPYTYSVCQPSVVFNPTSVDSIFGAFEESLGVNIAKSESCVQNKMDEIIKFLK